MEQSQYSLPKHIHKRRNLMALTKLNAPQIYHSYVVPKKMQLQRELIELKKQFDTEKDIAKKEKMIDTSKVLKEELLVYSV